MRSILLTLAATATLMAGGLVWTESVDARPRGWRGGYGYRAPVATYRRPYYGGYYNSWRRPYYGGYYGGGYYGGGYYNNWRSPYYPRYYSYPNRYSWGEPGVYFRY